MKTTNKWQILFIYFLFFMGGMLFIGLINTATNQDDIIIKYKHQVDSLQLVIEDQRDLLNKYNYYIIEPEKAEMGIAEDILEKKASEIYGISEELSDKVKSLPRNTSYERLAISELQSKVIAYMKVSLYLRGVITLDKLKED